MIKGIDAESGNITHIAPLRTGRKSRQGFVYYWFVLNAILEYIVSRFALVRMKHALFWRAYHQGKR